MRRKRGEDSSLSRRGLLRTTAAVARSGVVASAAAADPSGGASSPRTIDVRQFGATGDGTANDGPAINRAIQAVREQVRSVGRYPTAPKLVFPAGVYAVDETLNLTLLNGFNTIIDGDSSVILGRCAGEPVIDALGSRWFAMRDLTIVGDTNETPSVGIQIGRFGDRISGGQLFENVKVMGHYALASLLNAAAETVAFSHVFCWNERSDPNSYCLIQDGLNHFGAATNFIKGEHMARDQDSSFNENEFMNCAFFHDGGGVPVWLGDTRRHRFYRCYTAGTGAASFIIYCGPNGHTMLDIDCHCEAKGLRDVFVVTGHTAASTIHGFSYKDHAPYASRAVFGRAAPVENVTLEHARIEIGGFAEKNCRILDDPSHWLITGEVYTSSARQWNGGTRLTGTAFIGNKVEAAGRPG